MPVEASAPGIVVGIDGSEGGDRALDWALKEARRAGLGVLIVHAFDKSPGGIDPILTALVTNDAQAVLDSALHRARIAGVDARGMLVAGSAAKVLVEASHGAELLVVGNRGRSGLVGALLGSVSTACVRHATCPILIVPSRECVERVHRIDGESDAAVRHA